jgi:hypothetical protein
VAHNAALKTLAEHIAQQLKERGFCVVVDRDLERCWPSSRMARAEREREIQEFTESQGWTAAIRDAGFDTRAIFRKLEPGTDAGFDLISDRDSSERCFGDVRIHHANGQTIWIADAHRGDGKRFVVRTDEKLTAFIKLQSPFASGLAESRSPVMVVVCHPRWIKILLGSHEA